MSDVFGTDCCWVQLVKLGNKKLPLISSRGFTPEMQREMASIDMEHRFFHEVVGLGRRIVIPNLSRNGNYDIPVFEKANSGSITKLHTGVK